MKSIIQNKKECWWCGAKNSLHTHHVFNGIAERKKSEQYGLKIYLCATCHDELHCGKFSKQMKSISKKEAQKVFEKKYDHEMFMYVFGKDYLNE